jgi:hypothetical protein
MKVFQIRDDWGMQHLRLASRPDPRPGPGQVRLQGITVGRRDGFEAMAYLKSGAHFGKICSRH